MSELTDAIDAVRRWQAHRVLMAAFHGQQVPDWLHTRLADGLGSVCLFGSNLTGDDVQARKLADELHDAAPYGCLVTLDEEGGDVTRLDAVRGSETAGHSVLGAVDDPVLTRRVAARLGRRLRDVGVDLDLGPVADVNCEPDNPVIGVRSFGADPDLVSRHVEAFVDGLQRTGVAACVKHFPGHGATVEDSHLAAPRLDVDADTLGARELVPFAAAVRAGASAVMTSHVVVTALDPDRPATTSPLVLDLLRSVLGFDGVLVADALDMAGVAVPYGGAAKAAVAALAAGVDLLCLGTDDETGRLAPIVADVVSEILAATRDGRLPPTRLAEAAGRVEQLIGQLRTSAEPDDEEPVIEPGDGADPNSEAARRALRIQQAAPGAALDLTGALVVEFDVTPGIAAGVVPWGLAQPLSLLLPGIERRPAHRSDSPAELFAQVRAVDASRPVIAVVRDAHRHPWVRDQLAELFAARPDLVTVETGWPVVDDQDRPTGLPGTTRVWTYGGSAVSLRAAAELLAGQEKISETTTRTPDRGKS
jgi:beta-N-acetylhexosaminidase